MTAKRGPAEEEEEKSKSKLHLHFEPTTSAKQRSRAEMESGGQGAGGRGPRPARSARTERRRSARSSERLKAVQDRRRMNFVDEEVAFNQQETALPNIELPKTAARTQQPAVHRRCPSTRSRTSPTRQQRTKRSRPPSQSLLLLHSPHVSCALHCT